MRRLSDVPLSEILEYDVKLTGAVANRQIMTLEEHDAEGLQHGPLHMLADLGKRTVQMLVSGLAGSAISSGNSSRPKGGSKD